MNKLHLNICVDFDVVQAHRQLGTNISGICNDALAAYLAQQGADIKKQAEIQLSLTNRIVETSQAKAAVGEQVLDLLRQAKASLFATKKKSFWNKRLKKMEGLDVLANSDNAEYDALLEKAQKMSGCSKGELLARLQRL